MTIGGALSDLNNLLNADNIPFYYKPSIKAVMDTIISEYQKMGHWKAYTHSAYHGKDEDDEPIWREVIVYHCSECNRRTVIKENYCPNCGAKMQEVQNDD